MHGNQLGGQLKRARERAGLTQRQLAESVGVDRKTVGNWEAGVSNPRSSLGRLETVLSAYGFHLDEQVPPPAAGADALVRMIVEVLDSAFSPSVQVHMIRDLIEREYIAPRHPAPLASTVRAA